MCNFTRTAPPPQHHLRDGGGASWKIPPVQLADCVRARCALSGPAWPAARLFVSNYTPRRAPFGRRLLSDNLFVITHYYTRPMWNIDRSPRRWLCHPLQHVLSARVLRVSYVLIHITLNTVCVASSRRAGFAPSFRGCSVPINTGQCLCGGAGGFVDWVGEAKLDRVASETDRE